MTIKLKYSSSGAKETTNTKIDDNDMNKGGKVHGEDEFAFDELGRVVGSIGKKANKDKPARGAAKNKPSDKKDAKNADPMMDEHRDVQDTKHGGKTGGNKVHDGHEFEFDNLGRVVGSIDMANSNNNKDKSAAGAAKMKLSYRDATADNAKSNR
jgi:hypothetical protein